MDDNQKTREQILEEIKILTEVVKANQGWYGSSQTTSEANLKIKELMKKL